MPKDTSGDARPEPVGEHDIMARIDHLLKKLDEVEDVADKPLADEGPQSNMENVTVDNSHTATAQNIATDNLANTDSPVLSDAANYADVNPMLNVAEDGIAEDMETNRSVRLIMMPVTTLLMTPAMTCVLMIRQAKQHRVIRHKR